MSPLDLSSFSTHHFELSSTEEELFSRLLTLFLEYNAHTNLSAIRDAAGVIEKHFVDSLYGSPAIAEMLEMGRETNTIFKISQKQEVRGRKISSKWAYSSVSDWEVNFSNDEIRSFSEISRDPQIRLLDIGSGWGFPGIPLKIVFPEISVTLLDSVGKKVRAMQHFIDGLGLSDITVIQDRAEHLALDPAHRGSYQIITSRATAYITDILTWAEPFLAPEGQVILYKMPSDEEQKDQKKILKKLGLTLDSSLEYALGGKDRLLMVFSRRW